ncbi:hypothetical protein ACFCWB_34725 [Streptomyces bacillaris]|uniref:hypothetical protein n=1 Tax=Streptomyces bacillaris TaxID=68179 RepID=UPI0035DC3F7C
MVQKPESDIEPKERRIDLSLPQVAGSAVAAVAAAVAASQLGVYGTIAGAGVMSVVATCGGSVFQHFFRRTGEQIREVTVQVTHPEGRQVTVRTKETTPAGRRSAERRPEPGPGPAEDATTVLPTVDPGAVPEVDAHGAPDPERTQLLRPVADPDRTQMLGAVPAADDRTRLLGPVADPDRTQLLPQAAVHSTGTDGAPADDAFTEGTTHGTRLRGWKRPALAAAAVFAVAMGGITVFEMISGNDLSGGKGTTLGSVVRSGGGDRDSGPADPAPSGDTGPDGGEGEQRQTPGSGDGESDGSGTGSAPATDPGKDGGTSPDPGTGTGGESPGTGSTPTPTPSGGTTTPAPTPTPSAPDGNGTGAPDPTTGTGPGGAPGQGEQAPPAGGAGAE